MKSLVLGYGFTFVFIVYPVPLPHLLHIAFYLPFPFSLPFFPLSSTSKKEVKRQKYRIILIVQRALTSRQKKVSSLIFFVIHSPSSDTIRKSNPSSPFTYYVSIFPSILPLFSLKVIIYLLLSLYHVISSKE